MNAALVDPRHWWHASNTLAKALAISVVVHLVLLMVRIAAPEVFEIKRSDAALDVVLRPGCYLTHDVGIYRAAQSQIQVRNPVAHSMRSQLQPALQLWAYVQSIPEADKAIIALGKRDAAFDAGLSWSKPQSPEERNQLGLAAGAGLLEDAANRGKGQNSRSDGLFRR